MVLFDEHGRIKKYDTIDEIIDHFVRYGIDTMYYVKNINYHLYKNY